MIERKPCWCGWIHPPEYDHSVWGKYYWRRKLAKILNLLRYISRRVYRWWRIGESEDDIKGSIFPK